ncbi:glutamate ABC transporter substrate-binding protein [Pendulispora albinea]|uniref:Glutamate ABC transporter substrate-binding protein n=1 Tax=Pendulispora albinea TaxID=2741071 RepID=A0ABZ2M1M2_9BACT
MALASKLGSVMVVAVLSFAMPACNKATSDPPRATSEPLDKPAGKGDKCTRSRVALEPSANVALTGSKTFDKIKAAGKAVVGVKVDEPNLGYKDADGKRCGFDIEIAQLIAARLGVDPSKIEYREIPTTNRETAIKGHEIDYYVGTYSITDKRKNEVGFAGPYFIAGQDLLVRKDETGITGKDSLKGRRVCASTGSTPLQRVRDQKLTEEANISEFKAPAECVSQLLDNKTDAVTTDDAILKGFAAQMPSRMKVVGNPFSREKYGVGVDREDVTFRNAVNDILEAAVKDGTWQTIYDATLGRSGSTATPPIMDRY